MATTHKKNIFQKQETRPEFLSRSMEAVDFLEYYWLKSELLAFCSQNSLHTSGSKLELTARIAHFLKTGECLKPKSTNNNGLRDSARGAITASTIVNNYKSDPSTRSFFLNHIGLHFKFTVPFHEHRKQLLKNEIPFTYGDLAQFWINESEKKKNNQNYKQIITKSCEYNKFLQDFAKNEKNTGKNVARDAWVSLRKIKGPKTYENYIRIKSS